MYFKAEEKKKTLINTFTDLTGIPYQIIMST